jgi:hypothetical protein
VQAPQRRHLEAQKERPQRWVAFQLTQFSAALLEETEQLGGGSWHKNQPLCRRRGGASSGSGGGTVAFNFLFY